MTQRKILTDHINAPIPNRSWDWGVYFEDDNEHGIHEFGKTEQEAINNLLEYVA